MSFICPITVIHLMGKKRHLCLLLKKGKLELQKCRGKQKIYYMYIYHKRAQLFQSNRKEKKNKKRKGKNNKGQGFK